MQRFLGVKLASNICRAAVSVTNMALLMYFVQWVCNSIAHMYKCTCFHLYACLHMSLCPYKHWRRRVTCCTVCASCRGTHSELQCIIMGCMLDLCLWLQSCCWHSTFNDFIILLECCMYVHQLQPCCTLCTLTCKGGLWHSSAQQQLVQHHAPGMASLVT